MQYDTDTRPLHHAMAEIDALDLEPIKFKISCKEEGYGWTSEHVDRIERAYRRYLVVLAKFPQLQIAPTRDIDAFWHAHILDTRKYAADCERIFGGFVHHYPYLGLLGDRDKLDQAASTLRQLFVSEFAEDVPCNAHHADADGPSAAWCGIEPPADRAAAWCGSEPPADRAAAWCGGEERVISTRQASGIRAAVLQRSGQAERTH